MPKIFSADSFQHSDNELKRDYFDRHTPVIECADCVKEGEKLFVKVRVGNAYMHPDEGDHYIAYVQLWNRETLLAETRYYPGTLGNVPGNVEVGFLVVPKVSMNLVAMSYCTKHGLWQSAPRMVKVVHENLDCKNDNQIN